LEVLPPSSPREVALVAAQRAQLRALMFDDDVEARR
jgi:hypothetical protein